MPRKSQRNRKRYQMQSPLFRAALHYKFRARRARQAGARPLTDSKARAAAAELLRAAAQWRQEWSAWRIQVERPPPVSSEPLPPPETPRGAVIRSAKSLGYAYQINSPDKAALALALLEAAEALRHKLRPAVSPPTPTTQTTPAAAPEPALDESLARADRPEPVEG